MTNKYLFIIIIMSLGWPLATFPTSGQTQKPTDTGTESPAPDSVRKQPWVTAYLACWNHYVPPGGNWGNLPTNQIDWTAFTHMIYFNFSAQPNGDIGPEIKDYNNMSPDRIQSIVQAAHAHYVPILFTIGGWGNYNGFKNAIEPSTRSVFIRNLVDLMKRWGFDGIDVDMEPIQNGDTDNYVTFIHELRATLDENKTPLLSRPLLTAAVHWQPELFAKLQDQFDQINIMSYDFSGAWGQGWVTWYNSAVYNGGKTFYGMNKLLPSVNNEMKYFTDAGIPASKLGLGIDFYGYVWSGGSGTSTGGVSQPDQHWTTPPRVQDNVPYYEIMNKYFRSSYYHWDPQSQAAYLSIDLPGNANDKFISYDDERAIDAKVSYVFKHHLGGMIIFDLSGGYRQHAPAGMRDRLLQSVKLAVQHYTMEDNMGSGTPAKSER